MEIKEEAFKKAQEVLEKCARPQGFYASGLPGGYEAVWARDSMIASIGAAVLGNKFKETFKNSLVLLSENQSSLGQIPNAVGDYNEERRSEVTYNTIDSTLWYLTGHFFYAKNYGNELLEKYKANIEKAFVWLKYQDPNEDGLLSQQPTMDWQDAFPHKYGRAINTHALYYAVLSLAGKTKEAKRIQDAMNGNEDKYLSLYNESLGYYLPWAWKNHDQEREEEYWFDALGNLLAIVAGLADPKIAKSILNFIEEKGIADPYPCKCIFPPIEEGDKEWHSYFSQCLAKDPYSYLNAGIWPFIGGFYVAALVKIKDYKKAEEQLNFLAQANKLGKNGEWEFNEWLHGKTGKPEGNPCQAWSAGMYLYAYECVKQKRVLFF